MSSLPAGQEQDPVMTEWARDAFHEARLTNQQANMLIKKWNTQAGDMLAKSVEAQAKAYDNAVVTLKKSGENILTLINKQ